MSFSRKQEGGARAGSAAAVLLAASAFAVLPAAAQYPGQISDKDKNAPTMRAVAVLEWVGDLAHPKASRLVPITVWDGQNLQDGDIYLARPQPLALDSETEYELQKDGKNIGFYIIHDAAQQQDSWIGLGAFKALPTGPTPQQLAMASRRQKVDEDDAESDTPILHRKHHADDNDRAPAVESLSATAPVPTAPVPTARPGQPAGPTLHKGGDASGGSTASSGPLPTATIRTTTPASAPIPTARVFTQTPIQPAPHRAIPTGPSSTPPRPTMRRG